MAKVYLGLGSNLGDKIGYIEKAIALLENSDGIRNLRASSLYKTEPIGNVDQDWFVNAVVEIETDLNPMQLLECCQGIETKLGRKRIEKWGPRTLDIDVLLYGNAEIKSAEIEIPHPRMVERAFVLRPLAELNPCIEISGTPIQVLLSSTDNQQVEKIPSRLN